jgi:hypothetical protein
MTWKYESHRHALSAKGIPSTHKNKYFAARPEDIGMLRGMGLSSAEARRAAESVVEDPNVEFLESKGISEAEAIRDVELAPKPWLRFTNPTENIRIRITDDKPQYIRFNVPDKKDLRKTLKGLKEEEEGAKNVLFGDITRDPNYQRYEKLKGELAEDRTVKGAKQKYEDFEDYVNSQESPESYLDRAGSKTQEFVKYSGESLERAAIAQRMKVQQNRLVENQEMLNNYSDTIRRMRGLGQNAAVQEDQLRKLQSEKSDILNKLQKEELKVRSLDSSRLARDIPFRTVRADVRTVATDQNRREQNTQQMMGVLKPSSQVYNEYKSNSEGLPKN